MRMRRAAWMVLLILVAASWALAASNAELYFSSDKNGASRVTNVQEGSSVWIVVYDPDENIDCDVRDKIWTDVKIMDPKTGAYIVWKSYVDATGNPAGEEYGEDGYVPYKGHFPGASAGWLGADYLEETGADTGLFVVAAAVPDRHARELLATSRRRARTSSISPSSPPDEFQWGDYLYSDIHQEDVPTEADARRRGRRTAMGRSLRLARRSPYDVGFVDRRTTQTTSCRPTSRSDRGDRRRASGWSAGSRTWTR